MEKEDKKMKPAQEKGNGVGLMGWMVAFGYPLTPAFIIFFIFLILYKGTHSLFCLIVVILTVVVYLAIVTAILVILYKKDGSEYKPDPPYQSGVPARTRDTSKDEIAAAAGMITGIMLGHKLLEGGHHHDKNENDFLWQEKIRRDMHDDGFTDW